MSTSVGLAGFPPAETDGAGDVACAKINLALHVVGRRPDGLHNIETAVVFAEYGDILEVEDATEGQGDGLIARGPFGDTMLRETAAADNLVMRAAAALRRRAEGGPPVDVIVNKRLPVAAGLGGGSADAAATLRILRQRWQLAVPDEQLVRIAARLGADVPMCLASQPLVATGVGEHLRPIPGVPRLPVVLAFPGGGLPTRSVFAALPPQTRSGLPPMPERFASPLEFVFWLRRTRNDLARPAAEVSSLAGAAAWALHRDPECLFARMSGSGTSAFGIFPTLRAAERAADRIAVVEPTWWVLPTVTGASK